MTERRSLNTLQAGRAIAALSVVASHSVLSVTDRVGALPAWLYGTAIKGYLGVDFFFVLSGFIIYWTNVDRIASPDWSARYLKTRLTRIYAPYLPIGIAIALGYSLLPQLSHSGRAWSWFASLTLLPVGAPALSPAWTLQHEVVFYGLIWLLFRLRIVWPGLLMWAAAMFAVNRSIPLDTINVEFVFGVALAWLAKHDLLKASLLWIAAGVTSIAIYSILGNDAFRYFFGLGIACLMAPIIRLDVAERVRTPHVLVVLGNASYSIYLIHVPLAAAVSMTLPWRQPLATFVLLVAASTAAGFAYHRLFEIPVLGLSRRLLPKRVVAAE